MQYSEKFVRELHSFNAGCEGSLVGSEGQVPVYSQVQAGRVEPGETGKDL